MRDDTPIHRKLGFEVSREKMEIRAELSAKGVTGHELWFAVEHEYMRRHKDDETFKERSARLLTKPKKRRDHSSVTFTLEELAYLIDVFKDANHPTARQIFQKASKAI